MFPYHGFKEIKPSLFLHKMAMVAGMKQQMLLVIFGCFLAFSSVWAEAALSDLQVLPAKTPEQAVVNYFFWDDGIFLETFHDALKSGEVLELVQVIDIETFEGWWSTQIARKKIYWLVSYDSLQGTYFLGKTLAQLQPYNSFENLVEVMFRMENIILDLQKPMVTGDEYHLVVTARFETYPREENWLNVLSWSEIWKNRESEAGAVYIAR